jgi:hypothetical protein
VSLPDKVCTQLLADWINTVRLPLSQAEKRLVAAGGSPEAAPPPQLGGDGELYCLCQRPLHEMAVHGEEQGCVCVPHKAAFVVAAGKRWKMLGLRAANYDVLGLL